MFKNESHCVRKLFVWGPPALRHLKPWEGDIDRRIAPHVVNDKQHVSATPWFALICISYGKHVAPLSNWY